jgi:hypothetical protein
MLTGELQLLHAATALLAAQHVLAYRLYASIPACDRAAARMADHFQQLI